MKETLDLCYGLRKTRYTICISVYVRARACVCVCARACACGCARVYLSIISGVWAACVSCLSNSSPVSHFSASSTESAVEQQMLPQNKQNSTIKLTDKNESIKHYQLTKWSGETVMIVHHSEACNLRVLHWDHSGKCAIASIAVSQHMLCFRCWWWYCTAVPFLLA